MGYTDGDHYIYELVASFKYNTIYHIFRLHCDQPLDCLMIGNSEGVTAII